MVSYIYDTWPDNAEKTTEHTQTNYTYGKLGRARRQVWPHHGKLKVVKDDFRRLEIRKCTSRHKTSNGIGVSMLLRRFRLSCVLFSH